MADFALIEIEVPEMRYPQMHFAAYVEQPFDALYGVVADASLPLQGIALEGSASPDYVPVPYIAFPPTDGSVVATVDEEKKYFSLNLDMTGFDANAVIRIGLYGYVDAYNLAGGLGMDGTFEGVIFSSSFYGAVTKDFRGITSFTAAALAAAPEKLFLDVATTGFGYDRLITSFPGLIGTPYEYLGDGQGDKYWVFNNDFLGPVVGHSLGGGATIPVSTDANDYLIYPVDLNWTGAFDTSFVGTTVLMDASIQTVVNWGVGNPKTQVMNCVTPFAESGGSMVKSATLPPPPYDDPGEAVTVRGFFQTQYWLPTWRFNNDRPAPIRIATVTGANIWADQVEHDYNGSAFSSRTWETVDYPDRPDMAEIGTVIIPSLETTPDDSDLPAFHFGMPRIGTVILYRSTGDASFEPPAATDGTPDGDGALGDGTATGRTANPHLRVWTFTLDEHDFYVLRLGDTLTLVYDVYSEQWMDWTDFDSLTWRAHCGRAWIGAEALADTYGSNIVVGDDAYGLLWFLDPEQPFDDDPLGGAVPTYFSRVTMGQVPMKGREVLPCNAAWLTADMGDPAYTGASVSLWISDDGGETWELTETIPVTAGENQPELSWYSLGQIEAPGRLFKIFDDGAITRIDGLEMNDPPDGK